MANTIVLKKSAVSNNQPGVNDLVQGELAVNTADSKIYMLNPAGNAVIDYTEGKVDVTDGTASGTTISNGVTVGEYERVATVSGTTINVSTSNVQKKSISGTSTFNFTGWTSDASIIVLELTTSNSPVITFTGVTWAYGRAPVTSSFMRLIFTSINNGSTIRGSIIEDGSY